MRTFSSDSNNAKVNEVMGLSVSSPAPTKSIDDLASEVIQGKWGNGEECKQRLTAAGYSYSEIQNRVNELMGKKTTTKTVDQLAQEVIYDYWGNGLDRKNRLSAAGYDYATVQKRVNELMRK